MSSGSRRRWLGRGAAIALTLVTLAAAVPAAADVVTNDVALGGTGSGGKITVASGEVATVSYWIKVTGGACDASDGSPATIGVVAPAGVTVSPNATLTFTDCDAKQTVTFSAPPGTYDIPVVSVNDADGNDRYTVAATAFQLVVESPIVEPPADSNRVPVVVVAALDALGQEGDTLAASGRFSDADGDPLTLTFEGPGTFIPAGDGSWSWLLTTQDDVASTTATVTATDPAGATASDAFVLHATNAPPVLAAPVITADVAGCRPTVALAFSDAGSADTHSGVIEWGDGTADTFATKAVSLAHAFHNAGTYSATIRVTDDDGGSDAEAMSHRVHNTPSAVLQPINSTGGRSAFKSGSTVPVKITVADCDGRSVPTLAPQVSVVKLDATPDGTVVEVVSTATPTTGTTMRYDALASQYIYNLSTKSFGDGDWRVRISDGSFVRPVDAIFSVKR